MAIRLIEPATENERAREIPVEGEEFLIGRGTDCNLRLAVAEISRHHCLLRFRGGTATLSDLGSSNGTYVNGQRVRSQVDLRTGDEIRVGECRFLVDLGDKPQSEWNPLGEGDPTTTTCKIRDKKQKWV